MKSDAIKQILSLLLVLTGTYIAPGDELLLESYDDLPESAVIVKDHRDMSDIKDIDVPLPEPMLEAQNAKKQDDTKKQKNTQKQEDVQNKDTQETQTKQDGKKDEDYSHIYSDIALSKELQEYTYSLCQKNEIDYELVLAIMYTESKFNSNLISSTNDHGIMQINECNHNWLRKDLNITNFLDPKQNIKAGIHIITGHLAKQGDWHRALMAYNMGAGGMKKAVNRGNRSSKYSRLVLKRREDLINNGTFID